MKLRKIVLTVAAVVLCIGVGIKVQAVEKGESYQKLVTRWENERDELVRQITVCWLRGATAESLEFELARLVRYDVMLANEPEIPLYITSVEDPGDVKECLNSVVRGLMVRLGVDYDSSMFFRGKTFMIQKQDGTGSQVDSLTFMKWKQEK